jgi:hypothetical protein
MKAQLVSDLQTEFYTDAVGFLGSLDFAPAWTSSRRAAFQFISLVGEAQIGNVGSDVLHWEKY